MYKQLHVWMKAKQQMQSCNNIGNIYFFFIQCQIPHKIWNSVSYMRDFSIKIFQEVSNWKSEFHLFFSFQVNKNIFSTECFHLASLFTIQVFLYKKFDCAYTMLNMFTKSENWILFFDLAFSFAVENIDRIYYYCCSITSAACYRLLFSLFSTCNDKIFIVLFPKILILLVSI